MMRWSLGLGLGLVGLGGLGLGFRRFGGGFGRVMVVGLMGLLLPLGIFLGCLLRFFLIFTCWDRGYS